MTMKKFDTFADISIQDGERELFIRELTPDDRRNKYRTIRVRATISRQEIAGTDLLEVRSRLSIIRPERLYIKIHERLPVFEGSEAM